MRFNDIEAFLLEQGEKPFRLKQLKRAFYVEGCPSWEALSVWSKPLREAAAAKFAWDELTLLREQKSAQGNTHKALFRAADGSVIEAVLMQHYGERYTVCVSSQVGCAMGCTFCATGTMGWKRNLTAQEIIEQVVFFERELYKDGKRVTNIVFMGMGEPMHNYDEVLAAIHVMNDLEALGIGARKISISTSGVVPGILRLAQEPLQVNLAISIHAGTDDVRNKIMPVNRAYPLEKLMQAVATYMESTNRQVMFEYLLLKGVNDRKEDAQALAKLLAPHRRLAHVNVIKYHDTLAFQATPQASRETFVDWLQQCGVSATHRVTFGEDIDAACGQLAVRQTQEGVVQGVDATRLNREKIT